MILTFEPPEELIDFLYEAARAAAAVVDHQIDEERKKQGKGVRYDPKLTALELFGKSKRPPAVRARHVMANLARRHVYLDGKPGAQGTMRMAIVFNATAFPGARFVHPISYPMVAWLVSRCHTALVRYDGGENFKRAIDEAEKVLAENYADGVIEATVTFRSRQRTWGDD